jgi:hypothetical protein
MSLPYIFKLLCLCLASFFLVHLALALLIGLVTPAALRTAAGMKAAAAPRFLFGLRMFPAGFGVFVVTGICAPSYLWLEPKAAMAEQVGWACLALSILTVLSWGASIRRGWSAITRSIHYVRRCQLSGRATILPGEDRPVWLVEGPAGLFAAAGVVHPQVLLSRQVASLLSREQLAVALRHEWAHCASRDNLKRLGLLLAPGILPFFGGFEALERNWARYSERAADDRAVDGDAGRSLSLATALVRVSRLGIAPRAPSLAAPLLAADDDLSARVQRLLSPLPPAEIPRSWMACLFASAALVLSGAVVILGPALLYPAHQLLEHLIR